MTEYFKQALHDYEQHAAEGGAFYMDASLLLDIEEYYEKKGMLFEAEQAMRIAERLHPDSDEVKISRAYIEKNKGSWQRAFNVMKTVSTQESKDVQMFYAEYEVARNELNEAELRVKDAMPAVMEQEDYDWYLDFGETLVDYGYPERGLKYLLKIPQKYTFRTRVDELIAEAYNQQEYYEEAIEYAQRVTDADPYSDNAWMQLASLQQKAMHFEDCIHSCDYALAINEHNFQAMDSKVFALLSLNKEKEAMECSEEFMKREPENQSVRIYAGERYFVNSEYDKAINVLREALRICPPENPDRMRIVSTLSFCYMRMGWFEAAEELLGSLVASGQSVSSVYMMYFTACFDFHENKRAINAMIKALMQRHLTFRVIDAIEVAQILVRNHCYKEAENLWTFMYMNNIYRDEPELAALMALAFFKLGFKQELEETVDEALKGNPGFVIHYFGSELQNYSLGYILNEIGQVLDSDSE